MSVVKLHLDLTTTAGRAAMRSYIDALDRDALLAATPFMTITGGEQPAGEEAEAPLSAGVAETSFSPARREPTEGKAARDVEPFDGTRVPAEADVPGEALPRCGGSEGVGARPQQSPQAKPDLPPAGEGRRLPAGSRRASEPPKANPDPGSVAAGGGDRAGRVCVAPEGGASVDDLDPERPWTDRLRWQVWDMRETGLSPSAIAERLNLRKARVWSFFSNVKHGSVKLPLRPAAAVPAVAPTAGVLAVAETRRPAQDTEVQAARLDAMEAAEREKFVMRATHPEAFA